MMIKSRGNVTDVVTLIIWEKIHNAMHMDRHKCNEKDHFSKMCYTKYDQKEFAFILKEDEMSKRLKFCVGGVDLKMLVD